jgi:hypothetical protein
MQDQVADEAPAEQDMTGATGKGRAPAAPARASGTSKRGLPSAAKCTFGSARLAWPKVEARGRNGRPRGLARRR